MTTQEKSELLFHTPGRRGVLHWLTPVLLVLLFILTVLWLPWQAQQMEANERLEQLVADTLWVEQTIRFQIGRNEENIRQIGTDIGSASLRGKQLQARMQTLLRNNPELTWIGWYDPGGKRVDGSEGAPAALAELPAESQAAAQTAREHGSPQYSQPGAGYESSERMDFHLPLMVGGKTLGSLVASYSLPHILDEMVPWWFAQDNEIALINTDDTVLARRDAGGPGKGVFVHQRALDLPGVRLSLRTDSVKNAPKLLPNLLVGSVIALSIGLIWSLWALWRDINRRLAAEGALRQQVAFRTAMENSLVTGMRARDLNGRVTYVNPAFCHMVGLPPEELLGRLPPMPYWAPEAYEEYQERFAQVLAGTVTPQGFETVFQRANGERFAALIFESPLVDDSGRQTGWMGSILDISERKQIEDLNRQQQEKLQASARLATMGEIASTLAHELNQPLAAISGYTTGALNMLANAPPGGPDIKALKPALEKASAQAQRAGQIIRSVHAFVKKREPTRETVAIQSLIDSVMPLIELQAQQFSVAVQTSVAPGLPAVRGDRVLLEQVLLNLTRNGIEAMQHTHPEKRLLRIVAERADGSFAQPRISIAVIDRGHGIPADIAERLYSPFFSTKSEGLGIGLNICRTAVEFHGGTLSHADNPQGGTTFRFSLPAAEVSTVS